MSENKPLKIYLATPYSGTPVQQNVRFKQACEICADLIKCGHYVFSPIAHSHNISVCSDLPGCNDFWRSHNETWLEWCDELWIARMHRWDESKGIKYEIEWAVKNGVSVMIFDPAYPDKVMTYRHGGKTP